MNDIVIKVKDIEKLQKKAGELCMKPEGERYLLDLIDLKDRVEEAIENVKQALYKVGKELYPDFTGIAGDTISFTVSKGDEWKFEGNKNELPPELVTEVSYKRFNARAVNDYVKEHDLPEGIEKQDKPRLTIRRRAIQNEKIEG